MQISDIVIIIICVVGLSILGFYMYNRKNLSKMIQAQDFIANNKIITQVFIIDKKFEKPTKENTPKMIYDQLPKLSRMRKMALVKAKVGPQIVTLTCSKDIYNILTTKKSIKIELAGILINKVIGVNLEDKKDKTLKQKFNLFIDKKRKGV